MATCTPAESTAAPHVLCALFPAFGHLLPALPVVKELVQRGCRVTATIAPEFADRVREAGAEPVAYPAPLTTRLPDYTTRDRLCEYIETMCQDVLGTSATIENACPQRPDVLVYDRTLLLPGRVISAKWDRPGVQLVTSLASNEHFSIDEKLQDLAPPQSPDDPPHPAILRYCGAITEYVRGHGFTGEPDGVLAGTGETSIAFVPKEFQPYNETFGDDHMFVGPSPSEVTREWRPPENGAPVALISLGTTSHYSAGFLRMCLRAFADGPWHVVLALGGGIDPAELEPLPHNVELHRWIPIGAVLRHADLFVCQGGMSGIMEALSYGTPLLLVPYQPEQCANADRVEELGLGRSLVESQVSPQLLREGAETLLADNGLRGRLSRMRELCRKAGGPRTAADTIMSRIR
ncbi:glycosyltransferase [Streptomonospora sediminis]